MKLSKTLPVTSALLLLAGCNTVLTEDEPIGTVYTNEPTYTFSSTTPGTLSYGGDCSSSTTAAVVGSNEITFNYLDIGVYGNCTITLLDESGNESNVLAVSEFEITIPANQFFAVSPNVEPYDSELWKIDADGEMQLVKNINLAGHSDANYFHEHRGKVYFTSDDGIHGRELWVTDGTEAGTSLVKDIHSGSFGSDPQDFISLNDLLLFVARDGVNGAELWVSDGTEEGTNLLRDLRSGSIGAQIQYLTYMKDRVYFHAFTEASGFELWETDGTYLGTKLVKDIAPGVSHGRPYYITNFNDTLFFRAEGENLGRELWKSDGTADGTVLVADIDETGSGGPANLTVFNDKLYFTAWTPALGSEVWTSDGTTRGTILLKDIRDGAGHSSASNYTVADSALYFTAIDDVHGSGLWKTDGTEQGTVLVYDGNVRNLLADGDTLYFTVNDDLWKTDGTEVGTVKILEIGGIENLKLFDGKLFFFASDPSSNDFSLYLWQSDGTSEGTFRVASDSTQYIVPDIGFN